MVRHANGTAEIFTHPAIQHNPPVEIAQMLAKLDQLITAATTKGLPAVAHKLNEAKSKIVLWNAYGEHHEHMHHLLPQASKHASRAYQCTRNILDTSVLAFIHSLDPLIASATINHTHIVADILSETKNAITLWMVTGETTQPIHEKLVGGFKNFFGWSNPGKPASPVAA